MLTYELNKAPGLPLYEALYRCIRDDILSGRLESGTKLPSKRALSANLKVSKITVEGAYNQLLSEGYICSREKVGYFVEATVRSDVKPLPAAIPEPAADTCIDLTANGPARFPFSVWSKLQREVMLDLGEQLLQDMPNQGLMALRMAIARHLSQFRGMQVDPRNILIGAGTDFLYNLLIQLLGRDKAYAVEEPGYSKIRQIYGAAGARCLDADMDELGVRPDALQQAHVLHISPSHHFPTGLVTPLSRRQALLAWAKQAPDRWIIEDDYDSEFRFSSHPLPTMQSLDTEGKVIYMNTFSKTLAPSIRISYMVLPAVLMAAFHEKLSFYSCTVPSFEQHTLARFLDRGHFEKHINRMRKFYRSRRDRVLSALSPLENRITILEQNAGLHFLMKLHTSASERSIAQRLAALDIRVRTLSSYYHGTPPASADHCLVINYSGLSDEALTQLEEKLQAL